MVERADDLKSDLLSLNTRTATFTVRACGRTVEQTSMQLLLTEAGDQVSRESLYQRKHFVQQQQPQRTYGRAGGRRDTSITSGRISID